MKRPIVISIALAVALCAPVWASITEYAGDLTVAGGGGDGLLVATEQWNDPATRLSWVVHDTPEGLWHYEYTFSVPTKDISHMLIEASDDDPGPAFTSDNISLVESDPDGWVDGSPLIGLWGDEGSSNPGIPELLYGIKLNAGLDATLVTVSFYSDRVPTWGDFYAKNGVHHTGGETINVLTYNQGFLDADPTAAPSDGSLNNHLLVPDTATVLVPAPGAILLAGLGAGVVSWVRRRKML